MLRWFWSIQHLLNPVFFWFVWFFLFFSWVSEIPWWWSLWFVLFEKWRWLFHKLVNLFLSLRWFFLFLIPINAISLLFWCLWFQVLPHWGVTDLKVLSFSGAVSSFAPLVGSTIARNRSKWSIRFNRPLGKIIWTFSWVSTVLLAPWVDLWLVRRNQKLNFFFICSTIKLSSFCVWYKSTETVELQKNRLALLCLRLKFTEKLLLVSQENCGRLSRGCASLVKHKIVDSRLWRCREIKYYSSILRRE